MNTISEGFNFNIQSVAVFAQTKQDVENKVMSLCINNYVDINL